MQTLLSQKLALIPQKYSSKYAVILLKNSRGIIFQFSELAKAAKTQKICYKLKHTTSPFDQYDYQEFVYGKPLAVD